MFVKMPSEQNAVPSLSYYYYIVHTDAGGKGSRNISLSKRFDEVSKGHFAGTKVPWSHSIVGAWYMAKHERLEGV
jgi:hypothetical protein